MARAICFTPFGSGAAAFCGGCQTTVSTAVRKMSTSTWTAVLLASTAPIHTGCETGDSGVSSTALPSAAANTMPRGRGGGDNQTNQGCSCA
eukprot:scaffold6240_cov34-Phaeocystis_antarctica.AAC.2